LLTYSFGVLKWSKTNLQNINIQTRVLFTKFCKHHPKSAIERFNLPRENGGRGFSNLEILQQNQIASLKNYFLNRARDNTFFNALVSADKGYTPLNLSDNIISDIVEPNIPDTIANIKQKSLHGRYFKELEQPEINIQVSHAWLKKFKSGKKNIISNYRPVTILPQISKVLGSIIYSYIQYVPGSSLQEGKKNYF
jgi:hypothetical protein